MPLPLLGAVMGAAATAGKMGAMGAGAMARGAASGAGQLAGGAQRVMKASGKSPDEKKGMKALIDGPKRMFKQGQGMMKMATRSMGVSLGLASMMKQSQLFTGFLGAIFQVIGALVDAFLAPMMPTMFKLIAWMAKGVPKMQQMGQAVADWLGRFFKGGFEEKLNMLKDLLIKAIKGLLDLLLKGVKAFFGLIFSKDFWVAIAKAAFVYIKVILATYWALVKVFFGFLKTLWTMIWEGMKAKMPWLQKVEDFITNFISNLTAGFKAGWEGIKNWFKNTWDRFMLLWDKFKLLFFNCIHMIPGVDMEGSIATSQQKINQREQKMIDRGMDVTFTLFNNGHRLPIDGGQDSVDLTEMITGTIGSVASKLNPLNIFQ